MRESLFFHLSVSINLKIFIYESYVVPSFRVPAHDAKRCWLFAQPFRSFGYIYNVRASCSCACYCYVLNYSCSHCLLSLCDHLNSLTLATISFLIEIVEFKAFHNAHRTYTRAAAAAAAAATIATPSTESVCVYCAGTLQCDDDDVQGHLYSARESKCVFIYFFFFFSHLMIYTFQFSLLTISVGKLIGVYSFTIYSQHRRRHPAISKRLMHLCAFVWGYQIFINTIYMRMRMRIYLFFTHCFSRLMGKQIKLHRMTAQRSTDTRMILQ